MDSPKTYDDNLWHAFIKSRWRDATLALWYVAKATKLVNPLVPGVH